MLDLIIRTADDLASERLAAARENAALSRAQFADRAAEAGHITDEEAEAWAGGNAIPQWVADTIDGAIAAGAIAASERRSVRIALLTQPRIRLADRLIPLLADAAGLSEAQLDALFGVVPPLSPPPAPGRAGAGP